MRCEVGREGRQFTILDRMAREGFIEKTKCKEKNVQGGELSIHISEKITPEKGHSQYKHLKGGNMSGQGSVQRSQWLEHGVQREMCKRQCQRRQGYKLL